MSEDSTTNHASISISVQAEDFQVGEEYQSLSSDTQTGAVVTFVGKVREMNLGDKVTRLTLEHYPGMTEKALTQICQQAQQRWPIFHIRVIHRIGSLDLGDQIVFVGVTSAHRKAAFDACEYVMDYLKTQAPFWKKESTEEAERWIDARASDIDAAKRW